MAFRPPVIGTVAVLLCLPILIGLGFWQLGRHIAKSDARDEVHARLYAAPLTNENSGLPASELTWRKAMLTGQFRHDLGTAFVAGRYEFGRPGYDVVVPFDVAGGPRVLINRGWMGVSSDWQASLRTLAEGAPTTVEGLVQPLGETFEVAPLPATDDHPARWPMTRGSGCSAERIGHPYADIAATMPDVADWIVIAGPALQRGQRRPEGPAPLGGYVPEPRHIGHLEYAFQWWLIALTLIGVWAYAGWRGGQREG